MTLLQELKRSYGVNYPIILEKLSFDKYSYDTLRKMLSNLAKEQKLKRYSQGVYYFSIETELGDSVLPFDLYLREKYMSKEKTIVGYYSGLTLLNQFGLSTQVPNVKEIATNIESSRKRVVNVNGRNIILRKPMVQVTKRNVKYLQFLDIFRYASEYTILENTSKIINIASKIGLSKGNLDEYLKMYPSKVNKLINESGIYNEITRK